MRPDYRDRLPDRTLKSQGATNWTDFALEIVNPRSETATLSGHEHVRSPYAGRWTIRRHEVLAVFDPLWLTSHGIASCSKYRDGG